MPYRIYEPLSTHIPVWFFIHSLPMWNGVCRTDPADRLTPCSSLSCCSMSQTLLWLPCFLFSKGIITIQSFKPSATDGPCRSAAHTFPSSITIPCPICLLLCLRLCVLQTSISSRSSWLLITLWMS